MADSQDIIIKVPVAVPYQTTWDKPEAAEGRIEHRGKFYNLMTQQLVNDTLYIHAKYDQNARDQFMNLVSKINDQVTGNTSGSQNQSHARILKNFLKEYMSVQRKHVFYVLEWISAKTYASSTGAKLLTSYSQFLHRRRNRLSSQVIFQCYYFLKSQRLTVLIVGQTDFMSHFTFGTLPFITA